MLLREQRRKPDDLLTDYQLKSRMMGDYHVRFCERFGVKFPLPTRSVEKIKKQSKQNFDGVNLLLNRN
jgi:hypothetical protein